MTDRINRTVELLSLNQAVYYMGNHSGHVLTREQGREDAATWADYINVGMEHGAFNLAGLDQYLLGLVEGGPTRSGHRTPSVIVEAPVEGVTEEIIRANSWQFRQILGRGVHGILLCQAESASAVQAFVESCRYPINRVGVGNGLDKGRRGVGSENSATAIWGIERNDYVQRADPWPLNPNGELLLGVKIESAEALPYIEEILAVPGIGFAEMGPGDLSMSLGYLNCPRPFPPEIQETHERVRNACAENNVAFLSSATVDNIKEKIDEGVRIIQPGGNEEVVRIGREYSDRIMPW
ncbi:MAG: 2-keto-3-deoxy-L-rhamnonate aldolase [Candidatus Moanabacter tarae]|uniref:2-keto-3-deoxy-L-rhamnonate aldolase n=1 Tax=Candidatus Moanibacter tarae TaxID=2200854 RepID=A0A2Z4AC68_9BACT|nr:MAG: 2-keto-3-deoxy-L-rhamnonate aldolase [Candidatus Moanabacter tarae]|tara:strand:- start:2895 stop:3779 length:885 start_codon:yes stop_codon:yes gene_type:complete